MVLKERLAGRGFEFDVERAVFMAVLHRLMVAGSDRACAHWMEDYAIRGVDGLALHHFYRAPSWPPGHDTFGDGSAASCG